MTFRASMGMTATARSGVFTYDDFHAVIHDNQKGDLIDGVIYLTPPDSLDENELFGWLITVIGLYVEKKKLGELFGSRVACRLDDNNSPEPDILFVAEKNRSRLHRGGVEGPPDLAIEIVSPESVERDYDKKRRQYQQFKIPENWIIDEHEEKATLLRLDARGKYREVAPRKGIFHSQALEGFWLDPEWLWQGIRSPMNWKPWPNSSPVVNACCEDSSAPQPTWSGVRCSVRVGNRVESLPSAHVHPKFLRPCGNRDTTTRQREHRPCRR